MNGWWYLTLTALLVLIQDVTSDNNSGSVTTSNRPHLGLQSSTGCQIAVEKAKVVSRGIGSRLAVKVERYGISENITVNISSNGNTTGMELKLGYEREFETEITASTLGSSHYNICVSGCPECKEVTLYAIPAPLTLLPPILTVLLAVVTRQVLLSLGCGVFTAALLSSAYNPVEAFIETFNNYFLLPFLDPGKAGVILFSCVMSGLIEILEKAGGAKGFANLIFKLASTVYHAGILTVSISFAFFFDDFASIMISGKSLGPLVSELGLSVQKFSFIVHMMAVVVASLCPLSSWAGIQIGYIESAFKLANMEVSGFSYLVQSIPYRFFVVTTLLATVIYVFMNKDIAPMITYEEDQLILNTLKSEPDPERNEEEEKKEKVPERWYNAILPLLVLVVVSLLRMYYDGKQAILESGEDLPLTFLNCASKCNSIHCLIIGTSVSLMLTIIMIPAQRIMGLGKCLEYFVEGVKNMSEPVMILILAWSLGFAMNDIHTSEYIALALGENMPVQYFPSLVCVIGYAMSYASGSAMGTQGIIFPLIVPVIVHLTHDQEIYVKTIAAAFSSTVFGNLCSPIADTTIAGVLFTGCPMLDHIKVMTTFCVPVAVLTLLFGDLLVGMDLYPFYVSYMITILIVVLAFGIFGRSPRRRSVFQTLIDRVQGIKRIHSGSTTSSETSETTRLLKEGDRS